MVNGEAGLREWEASARAALLLSAVHIRLYEKLIFNYAGNILFFLPGIRTLQI